MRANSQALQNIGNRMSPFGNLLDCISLEIFRKSWMAYDRSLPRFVRGKVSTNLGLFSIASVRNASHCQIR